MNDTTQLLEELRARHPVFEEAQAVVETVRAVGDMLERMRERNGLSQAEVAQALGITPGRVSQLESGTLRNAVSLKTLVRFAHACNEAIEIVASGERALVEARPAVKWAEPVIEALRESNARALHTVERAAESALKQAGIVDVAVVAAEPLVEGDHVELRIALEQARDE